METNSVVAKAYTNPATQGQRSQQTQQVRQPERSEQQVAASKAQTEKQEQSAKPVANAQGQKTGQVINTTA
jgi:hypothetical protein